MRSFLLGFCSPSSDDSSLNARMERKISTYTFISRVLSTEGICGRGLYYLHTIVIIIIIFPLALLGGGRRRLALMLVVWLAF